jgi:uncharacterized protein (TIGR03083 family)
MLTPSLCDGWDVKTVAGHLVSVFSDSFWTFQWTALRRGGVDRAIDHLARRRARLPAPEIAATLRRHAERPLSPPITGPLSGLTDVLVHGGDIRIPLGFAFCPDSVRVSSALDLLTGPRPLGFVPRAAERDSASGHRRWSGMGIGCRGDGTGVRVDDDRVRPNRVTGPIGRTGPATT